MPVEIDAASLAGARRLPASKLVLARLGDERLVDQLHRGNEAAFEVIYERHHRSLLSFCAHMLGSREAGEEAVQHSFLSAYGAVVSERKKPGKLKAWLFAVARNRCVSMLRARREEPHGLGDDLVATSASPPAEAERRAEMRQLVADIGKLPEDQRAALVMSQLEDLSHAEVADALGCPASKVKSLVFQARSTLLEGRAARELPCDEVREEIASLRRLPRGGRARRHVRHCTGCAAFAEDVRHQRQMLALALPIVPSAGLKRTVLAGIGGLGGGGGAGGGGLAAGGAAKVATSSGVTGGLASGAPAAGGGLTAALTSGGVVKLATATLAAGSLAAGALTADHGKSSGRSSDERTASAALDGASADRAPAGQGRDRQEARADRPRGRGSERSAKRGGNGRRAHGRPSGNPAAGPPGGGAKPPAHASRPAGAGSGGQPPQKSGSPSGGRGAGSDGSTGNSGGGGSGSPAVEVPVKKPRGPKLPDAPDSKLDDTLRDAPSLP